MLENRVESPGLFAERVRMGVEGALGEWRQTTNSLGVGQG